MRIVFVVLATLLAISLGRRLLARAAYALADKLGKCGVCFRSQGDYRFSHGDGPDFWLCLACAEKKLRPITLKAFLENGTLRRREL